MPNRIVKESICTSDDFNDLSWFEQNLFIRLIVSVDDYGRFDARPAVIRGRLYPLSSVSDKIIADALSKLSNQKMVSLYNVDGKPYLEMTTWLKHQTPRAKESKYPSPEYGCKQMNADENICKQMQADAPDIRYSDSINDIRYPISDICADALDGMGDDLKAAVVDWLAYKKEKRQSYKDVGLKAFLTQVKNNADTYGESAVAAMILQSMSNGYQGVTWDRLKTNQPKNDPLNSHRLDWIDNITFD